MDEQSICQELLDSMSLNAMVPGAVFLDLFCEAVTNLQSVSTSKLISPKRIVKYLYAMQDAIGPEHMGMLFEPTSRTHRRWVECWCPQPHKVKLASACCPPATLPLWSNGESTVYARLSSGQGGEMSYVFCLAGAEQE